MNSKNQILGELRKTAKPYDHLFIFSLSFMFLSGIANILPSWLIKISVDGISALGSSDKKFSLMPKQVEDFLTEHYADGLNIDLLGFHLKLSAETLHEALYLDTASFTNILPIGIVTVFTIDAIFKLAYIFSIRSWGLKIVEDLRNQFHLHLNRMGLKEQEKYDSASLVSVVSSDLQSLQSWLSETITNLFNDGFKALFLFSWLLFVNLKLTLLTLVTIPLFALPVIKIGKKIRKYSKSGQDYVGQISSFINETLINQRIIKAFNLENWRQSKFIEESKILYKLQSNWFLFMSIVSPITNIVAAIGISIILHFGLKSITEQHISIGEFSSFFVTSILLYDPIKRLGRVSTILQSALGVAERVYQVLGEPVQEDKLSEIEKSKVYEINSEKIKEVNLEFKNVVFEYNNRNSENTEAYRIFNNLNLFIPAKTSLAIVGPSGSGKTSLVSLIPRFYEINAGEILINSKNIYEMSLEELRKHIALVSQDPLLFTGTLKENLEIVLRKTLSEEEKLNRINTALDKAFLREFLSELDSGLDTHLGERGMKLSLGQRQRVSLARAFLSEAPIVILDEPTSALDNKSQQFIYSSIQELRKDRTLIIIAHRLDTIQSCDKIIYLENGEILETGTYNELSADKNSKFSALLDAQLQSN